jgi:anti-sigma regulatory factor (Ser/Thr protein kinase)
MGPGPVLTKTLPAVPASVATARRAVAAFAQAAGVDEGMVDDLRLVVSEAVSNAVLHAYDHEPGTVQLTVAVAGEEIWVLVADDGGGFRAGRQSPGLGLGLPLIARLSADFAIESGAGGGTELKIRFPVAEARPAEVSPITRAREAARAREARARDAARARGTIAAPQAANQREAAQLGG